MRRFTQIMIACLLVVLLTLVSVRIGTAGTAKAFSPCGSWTIIHSPNPPQTINSRLFGVAAISSPNTGTLDNVLNGVSAVASSNIYAVGFYKVETQSSFYFQTLIERWNGTAWQAVSNPSTAPTSVLGSVTVVPGTSQLWAVGSATSAIHPHVVKTLTEFYC
jgi:hypothetical protein